jgi:hypothetical protein
MSEQFLSKLPHGLTVRGSVERRLLTEYGAVFMARGVTVPPKIVFRDESEVSKFQSGLSIATEVMGEYPMELQSAAMEDLRSAIQEAYKNDLSITPRDTDSARRSYGETVALWASRVQPALTYWVEQGRMSESDASRIRSLPPFEQVPVVLELEEDGIFFAKDLSKSIVHSVAPPGTSQHLSLLAFDIREHADPRVRDTLYRHGWYQTVVSDLPHFTYLGVPERGLEDLGLKSTVNGDRRFWVPDL